MERSFSKKSRRCGLAPENGFAAKASFATFAPFSLGNSILGYGMSLASAAAVAPNMAKRPIAVMGDADSGTMG